MLNEGRSEMALVWEKVESKDPFGHYVDVERARVPGGWLVAVTESETSITFYPDPNHEWDGSSL